MAPIAPSSLVLVSGASGFIATWCCHELLSRGHSVLGTVRSASKGDYLVRLFERSYPAKFSYVIAEDLEQDGVFDKAVREVEGVLHTASPFHFNADGKALEALVNPAVKGTKNMLKSVLQHGDNVKRVLITSSYAAVLDSEKPVPQNYTEADWNLSSPRNSEKQGNEQPSMDAYRASKTLAERAAWDFVETHKPAWDIATMNPPLVIGPIIHQVESPEKLNTSSANIWGIFHGAKKEEDLPGPAGAVVDVRDLAKAHVEALLRAEAGGNRFLPTIGKWTWQEVADIVHSSSTLSSIEGGAWVKAVPVGKPGTGASVEQNNASGAKTQEKLDVQYRTLRQTVEASALSLKDYVEREWKGVPGEEVFRLP